MVNTTIKKKKCKCSIDCDKYPTMSFNGYYYLHAPQEIKDRNGERSRKGYQVKLNRQKSINLSRKVKTYAKAKTDEKKALKWIEQNKWFKEREKEVEKHPYCSECGKWIPAKFYRHSVAHIFPKALFPSVATHPLNYLILAVGCCHDKTHRLDTFSQMDCFEEAIKRFKVFEKEITETHKYKDLFIEYAIKMKLYDQ